MEYVQGKFSTKNTPDIFLANESSQEYILISRMLFRTSVISVTLLSVTFTVSTRILLWALAMHAFKENYNG